MLLSAMSIKNPKFLSNFWWIRELHMFHLPGLVV